MLSNLRAEMTRHGVTAGDLARATGRTDRCIRDKISQKRDFTFSEALTIRETLFPGLALEYLFASDGAAE